MTTRQIHFIGLLANVDSSIQGVNFEKGFKIEAKNDEEVINLVATLEHSSFTDMNKRLYRDLRCHNFDERKIYLITNTFAADFATDQDGIPSGFVPELEKFDDKLVHGYLESTIRLMRLYKEGNICLPVSYYFFSDHDGKPRFLGSSGTSLFVSHGLYTLNESDLVELQNFLRSTQIPFSEPFLQLAFESFERSYQLHDVDLAFLSLMICLEVLFHDNHQEITYKISRNTAVLLGKDKEESEKIFEDIKDLYRKRSIIIHGQKRNIIDKDLLLFLRHYVRNSIKTAYKLGKNKKDLLSILNASGFGYLTIS